MSKKVVKKLQGQFKNLEADEFRGDDRVTVPLKDWPKVADLLKQRGWTGNVCLTAEYSDHDAVDKLIAEDIIFAKSCFA